MAFRAKKLEDPLLDGVTSTGASRWINVSMYDDLVIHLTGLASGDTVEVEGTNFDDQSNPDVITSITDSGDIVKIEAGVQYLRLNLSTLSGSGPIDSRTMLRKRL